MTPGPAMSLSVAGTHHLAIKVRDLAVAERFYVGVLGLRIARRWPAAGGAGDRSIWLDVGSEVDAGGSSLPFLALETLAADAAEVATDPNVERPGHHLVAFRIHRDQRAAWETRLAAAGTVVSHRSDYTLYFRDPEGNRLGLSHYPDPTTDG